MKLGHYLRNTPSAGTETEVFIDLPTNREARQMTERDKQLLIDQVKNTDKTIQEYAAALNGDQDAIRS